MNEIKRWYAVHTRPGQEKKVTEILIRKKIEYYCPLNKVVLQWGPHKRLRQTPLFNSYMFVKITENEIPHLRETDQVISFLFWLGKPAVIPDEEIETIRQFLNKYCTVRLEKIDVNANYTPVSSGYTSTTSGSFHFENEDCKGQLPLLGYLMVGEAESINLEVEQPLLTRVSRNWMQFEQKIFRSSKLILKSLTKSIGV